MTCIEQNNCGVSAEAEIATEDYESVLRYTSEAWDKDFERLMTEHEPHIMKFRDEMYMAAIADGITCESPIRQRLLYIGKVIEYTYMNVNPPNEYTAITDRKHFKEVAVLAINFDHIKTIQKQKKYARKTANTKPNTSTSTPPPQQNHEQKQKSPKQSTHEKKQKKKISLTLVIACWCHDIERFLPCTKCKYLHESVDHYRKQVIHPITSAKVCRVLLNGAPVTVCEKNRISQLIMHHDMPHPSKDIFVLGQCVMSGIKPSQSKIAYELQILMDADSYAFFQSTIALFIDYKAKKNSPAFVWKRVLCNLLRLRPYLRPRAVELIQQLPDHLRTKKMSINHKELQQALLQTEK